MFSQTLPDFGDILQDYTAANEDGIFCSDCIVGKYEDFVSVLEKGFFLLGSFFFIP